MTDQTTESNNPLDSYTEPKTSFLQSNKFLLLAGFVLLCGGAILGYSVGHRQGLSVVGYDADAQELIEVLQKQKDNLSSLNKSYNMAIQERDVAVSNTNNLTDALNQAQSDLSIAQSQSQIYRQVLRQRGGLSLTVQNLNVKPLPENAYEYQLDLAQVSPNNSRAVGSIEIRLIRGSEVLAVPMEDSNFNFVDFERLTGRWTMPKGFVPQFIEVHLNGAVPEVKRFSWLRGEEVAKPSAFVSEVPQAEARAE
ncbi:DUF6776 family protein [Acinetobacter sp. MB5]|uniref:DUF6776 family protein n=1 Tax=Acinetobacter sp. MB5 TaxID=2069438 RepID=UPI000DCFE2CD|nr:DUF6776 family protein [Acinetobacter sp. MB5]